MRLARREMMGKDTVLLIALGVLLVPGPTAVAAATTVIAHYGLAL